MKKVLRPFKSLAFPFIHSAFPRIQRARPKSRFAGARFAPTACPQAGASAEPAAGAKPALAPASPAQTSQAGRGLHPRSGNAAFRRQRPQTAQTRRGRHTAPIPGPTTSRFDVAEVAKSGCVDGCIPAIALSAGGRQISHSEGFDDSLSLNDPPNIDPPNIDRR